MSAPIGVVPELLPAVPAAPPSASGDNGEAFADAISGALVPQSGTGSRPAAGSGADGKPADDPHDANSAPADATAGAAAGAQALLAVLAAVPPAPQPAGPPSGNGTAVDEQPIEAPGASAAGTSRLSAAPGSPAQPDPGLPALRRPAEPAGELATQPATPSGADPAATPAADPATMPGADPATTPASLLRADPAGLPGAFGTAAAGVAPAPSSGPRSRPAPNATKPLMDRAQPAVPTGAIGASSAGTAAETPGRASAAEGPGSPTAGRHRAGPALPQADFAAAPAVATAFRPAPVDETVLTPATRNVDLPTAQPALGAALGRLRSRADGTHELSVALHPAELGQVGISATVRDGTLTVTVACADHAAREAVRAALPTLHDDLARAGFTGVDVAFSDRGGQPDSQPAQPGDGWPGRDARADGRDQHPAGLDATPRRRPVHDAALDRWL